LYSGESDATPAVKLFGCRFCVVEMAGVELADGTTALVCVDCDAIGLEHEIARGGPMWSAGLSVDATARRRPRSRPRRGREGAVHGR
jgi:hypothetical protein